MALPLPSPRGMPDGPDEPGREPAAVRRHVLFRSAAFNTTEPRDYFINPGCFGDDLARWLAGELRARGVEAAEEPGQEDFGWFFSFRADDSAYDFILGYRPGEGDAAGDWVGTIERRAGLLASMFGARGRAIGAAGARAIHAVLAAAPQISDVRWFSDEDCATEENPRPHPCD